MILTEAHVIRKKRSTGELFHRIDNYCYLAKNLHNAVNYRIKQCIRICRKLKEDQPLEKWEQEFLGELNEAIVLYNAGRAEKKQLHLLGRENGNIADAYFLSWYLKGSPEYCEMPYATCSQICIQNVCRNWKSFYRSMKEWKKNPEKFHGMPRTPGYLDKTSGREPLVLTKQNISEDEHGTIRLPRFLEGIYLKTRKTNIHQIRILTEKDRILIDLLYEQQEEPPTCADGVMGIDLGINNLMTVCTDTGLPPFIINGRPLKSINQYYNKKKALFQSGSMMQNGKHVTQRIRRLTGKRNRKVKDYMHKASRTVIRTALENGIGTIVIGKNSGWKQEVSMGNRTNQNFVGIPYYRLIEMIRYKAVLAGIRVVVTEESYTSGTSYLDEEQPIKKNYDKSRRIHRGLFRSSKGILINADVNAAYQIMKKAGLGSGGTPKSGECVRRIKVA